MSTSVPFLNDILHALSGHEEELAVIGIAGIVLTALVLVGIWAVQPPLSEARLKELKRS